MFVLGSIVVGVAVALALGGSPARVLALRFRAAVLVPAALAVQIAAFSRLGSTLPEDAVDTLHLSSYALLGIFGFANRDVRALRPVIAGTLLNALVIAANGGRMPLDPGAAAAAGIEPGGNVDLHAGRFAMLGDVFAIPSVLPLANAFSLGDVLIGFGMVSLLVHASLQSPRRPLLRLARLRPPLASDDFRRLVGGRLVSTTGDWLTTAALVGWVYEQTGDTLWVALVLAARLAPPLVGGGVAAAVVDRLPKRTLLATVEVARAVVVLLAFVAILYELRAAVVACMAVSGGLATLTSSLVPAIVPALVPDRRLEASNALLGVVENVAMAGGAAIGAIALTQIGAGGALVLDALTFVVAALLFARIRTPAGPSARDDVGDGHGAMRYLLGQPRLRAAVGCFAAAIVATGLASATLPRLLTEDVGAGAGAYGFGMAALGIGLAFGQLAAGSARIGRGGMRWLGSALALMAVAFAILAITEHAPTVFLLLALIGLVDGSTDGVFTTIVQRETDPGRHGAVFGVASSTFSVVMLSSVAAAPLLNAAAPAGVAIGIGAVALVGASAIAFAGARSGAATSLRLRAPRAA